MPRIEKRLNIITVLIIYTLLFVAAQLTLVLLFYQINGFFGIARNAIAPNIFFSHVVFFPFLYFFIAQIILYGIYIYSLWYVISRVSELFSFGPRSRYYLTLITWGLSVLTILFLNMYYVPHSIFSFMIRHDLLNDGLTDHQLNSMLITTVCLLGLLCLFAFVQACLDITRRKKIIHHAVILGIVIIMLFSFRIFPSFENHKTTSAATTHKPNIILIGFDALRPDFLSYFNHERPSTPNFDAFLRSSIVFTQAYTPLARTLPSWGGILTANYPIHSHIRENNVFVPTENLLKTLPKQLKQAGYETIYATDDRRFNNIDTRYGFDQLIGPPGTVADFLIGSISDFPLSNLFVPTRIGKILFPYSYANHGAQHTFEVDNFLEALNDAIQRTPHAPLFLAVHFNLSAWPFIWFNDKQAYNVSLYHAYSQAVLGDDRLLEKFLDLLKQNQLLQHAIVVLLSDHGISLALPGDRIINEERFQGNKTDMKVRRSKYVTWLERMPNVDELLYEYIKLSAEIKNEINHHPSRFLFKNFGVDTSFGYGGDILTFKQHHTLFAMKAFGFDFAAPHEVTDRVLLLDIAPTLLDLLHLPALPHVDGISLKTSLLSSLSHVGDRTIYLESGFSFNAIEQENIIQSKVLSSSIYYYMLSPRTGFIMLNPAYLNVLIQSKQRAVLRGDWMLAYYPISERYKFLNKANDLHNKKGWEAEPHLVPAYFVLVNLKTGEWTTEKGQPLFLHSPSLMLDQLLGQFYGKEMRIYQDREKELLKNVSL